MCNVINTHINKNSQITRRENGHLPLKLSMHKSLTNTLKVQVGTFLLAQNTTSAITSDYK